MTNICDIYNMVYFQAVEFEHAAQDILKNVGSQVADVSIVINCWATRIEPHLSRVNGFELTHLTFVGVEQS